MICLEHISIFELDILKITSKFTYSFHWMQDGFRLDKRQGFFQIWVIWILCMFLLSFFFNLDSKSWKGYSSSTCNLLFLSWRVSIYLKNFLYFYNVILMLHATISLLCFISSNLMKENFFLVCLSNVSLKHFQDRLFTLATLKSFHMAGCFGFQICASASSCSPP